MNTIKDQLYNIMKNALIDGQDLNLRYIFDHEKDYIDILDKNIKNVSREWCEYRIKSKSKLIRETTIRPHLIKFPI